MEKFGAMQVKRQQVRNGDGRRMVQDACFCISHVPHVKDRCVSSTCTAVMLHARSAMLAPHFTH